MQNDPLAQTSYELHGVYFAIEELQTLVGLSLPGVRIEIATTPRAYEEIAIIRVGGSILGTLHKTPEDLLILTREDPTRLLSQGSREAYLTIDDAASGIARLTRLPHPL